MITDLGWGAKSVPSVATGEVGKLAGQWEPSDGEIITILQFEGHRLRGLPVQAYVGMCPLRGARRYDMPESKLMVLTRRVESKILVIKGRKVILDADLAELYGAKVKRLNEQVRRNAERFPDDFVFRTKRGDLRSQFATSNEQRRKGRGGRRSLPFAFTEHGAIMAATVLNTKRAVQMSIFVVRAFVRMREELATNQRIVAKLKDLERRVGGHDEEIGEIVAAIREMMRPPAGPRRRIGFAVPSA